MIKTTQTSQETSNTTNSNVNANIPQLDEASRSEEENIEMRKGMRKIDFENTNKEVKGISSK